MATEIEIHPVQAGILRNLLFRVKARFSELNKTELTNDHFTFHLQQLLLLNLIEKTKDGQYRLTPKGKEFANRLDTETIKMEKQAKLGVCVICVRKKKGRAEYLVQQRLKQPYYGFYGFVTGKIRWGETIEETAQRELKEEGGLTAKLIFAGMEHKMDYASDKSMLEDKFFLIFRGENPKGKFVEKFEGGKNLWLSEKEIKKLPNLFKDVVQIIQTIKGKKWNFFENKFTENIY